MAEQHQAFADELTALVVKHRAAGTLPAAPALLLFRAFDEGTAADEPLAGECPDARQCAGACGICLK
jgi:hypothetical protein